jgi:predicted esterase
MTSNMHKKNIQRAGKSLKEAEKALILIHGRGANARDILGLASHLNVADYALLAPEATNHTWYPYSFMAKPEANEPWLSSALDLLKEMVDEVAKQGIKAKTTINRFDYDPTAAGIGKDVNIVVHGHTNSSFKKRLKL